MTAQEVQKVRAVVHDVRKASTDLAQMLTVNNSITYEEESEIQECKNMLNTVEDALIKLGAREYLRK